MKINERKITFDAKKQSSKRLLKPQKAGSKMILKVVRKTNDFNSWYDRWYDSTTFIVTKDTAVPNIFGRKIPLKKERLY